MDLLSYIKAEMQKGKDIQTIKQFLISRGYNPMEIERAIDQAYVVKHEIHFSKTASLALILIVVGLGVVGAALFFFSQGEALLDLQTRMLTTTAAPGADLKFSLELINMGSSDRFDVAVMHNVIDAQNRVVTSSSESVAIETRSNKGSSVTLPKNLNPGTYDVRTTARYDGKVATASFSFVIEADELDPELPNPEQLEPEIPEIRNCPICNDQNSCTRDLCDQSTNFQCRYEVISPCCGNAICEPSESFESCSLDCDEPIVVANPEQLEPWEKVQAVGQLDPEEGGELCLSIVDAYWFDQCFSALGKQTGFIGNCDRISDLKLKEDCYIEVAVRTEDTSICDQITKDTRRDACYVEFFKDLGDYSVCDKIINTYFKDSCEALKSVS